MWRGRVGAHTGLMTPTYDQTRALVAERQGTLRNEARQNRLAACARRTWRGRQRAARTTG